MIQPVKLFFRDLKEWIVLEKYRGTPTSRILFYRLPLKSLQKLYSTISGIINNYLLVNILNSNRFRKFQDSHQVKLGNHFYIIVMPNILHFLIPCVKLIPRTINVFFILNGTSEWEDNFLREAYKNYPIFKLKLLPHSSLSHGRLLNLLLTNNNQNFGIIDHDLYIFNRDIFGQLIFNADEFVIGLFKVTNKTSQLTFPTTHFMFFNIALIKNVMFKYNIGAQKYRRIPARLKKKLATLHIGYHNFLKGYLNYFDTLNLIMAMAFYERLAAKILEVDYAKDVYHLGTTSHGPDNLYRTYRSLKFLEMPANKSLREKNYDQFANLGSSKNLLKLFPDDVNSIQFIHQTDQFMEKLQEHLQE